jgi:membrane protein YqaA with SNARE-associated domain
LIDRYGYWAVALGALTPIPFSITCWSAGMLRLGFGRFLLVALLRVPRFVGYYVVIAYSSELVRVFW